ncbi:hypothetical protein C8Q80DRAFT_1122588 [Daedaleopsis nitida]|nr:hypothetical protein C8Q80DRAFT_1122588 [Daedaleopsis nitida]
MDNIRSFHWYCSYLFPKPYVLDALAKSSGPLLTEISLPYMAALKVSLSGFPNLRVLRLVHDNRTEPEDYGSPRDLTSDIEANSIALTHLSVYPGSAIWKFPMRSFLELQELEIIEPDDLGGLVLVFHHCSALRSLALCALTFPIAEQLVPLLTTSPATLPDLTALKIMIDPTVYSPPQVTVAVSTFLANKRRLRMLDTILNEEPDSLELHIWESLPELPALEVLGFDLHSRHWSTDETQRLDQSIPLSLSALLVDIQIHQPLGTQTEPYSPEWISLIRKRTSLGYLHVLDVQGTFGRLRKSRIGRWKTSDDLSPGIL